MKEKIITAILVIIVGIILLPLAKFNEKQDTQELKGISARDIQFIESIGFVDNLNGSWTLTTISVVSSTIYYFDFIPIVLYSDVQRTHILGIQVLSVNVLRVLNGNNLVDLNISTSSITIYGGDVS